MVGGFFFFFFFGAPLNFVFEVTFQVKDDSLGLVEWKVWIDISGGELETVQRYGACWIVKWLSNRLEILVLIFFK